MNPRLEAYSRKLEESLSSHHRFPINLEWLVDLFKYKHISSLTTHLKRHFNEKIDYKRIPEGQNKRTWSYHITVDCFSRICHYCRHSERKIVAKYWLRKIIIIRRDAQAASNVSSSSSSCEDDDDEVQDDEDDDEEDDEDEEMIMDDEEEESEADETNEDDSQDSISSNSSSPNTSPENSPRYSPSPSSLPPQTLSPASLSALSHQTSHLSDMHYPLDWSYLKLRSYDIASLYHIGSIHTFHHHHHHCYIPSHNAFSSPCCNPQSSSSSYDVFCPSSEELDAREDYPMDTSFDTNAFLSIPDDADDEESPRSSSTDSDN